MYKDLPIGVAQRKVLTALGLTANGFGEANAIFEKLGLNVTSKRVGRSSEPVVEVLASVGGGWTGGGDGESYHISYRAIDLTPLFQWMSAGDQRAVSARQAPAADAGLLLRAPKGADLSAEVEAERAAVEELRRQDEAARKVAHQTRTLNQSRLYAAGYRWRNLGNSDDGADWTLYAPTGEAVTVDEALAALEA